MLNDTVISGLINLFALLSARYDSHADQCQQLLDNYLSGYFGIRNKETYIGLYSDLRELYDGEGLDKDHIILEICNNIKGEIASAEQKMMLLRLMEFCRNTSDTFDANDEMIMTIGNHFGVGQQLHKLFADFVNNKATDVVKLQNFPGYDGYLRTLWLTDDHRMLFTYVGHDDVLLNDVPVLSGVFMVWQESCVLKNHKGAPLYYTTIRRAYDTSSHHEVEFVGRNLNFRFPNSDNGVHNMSFVLHSGELVAIMGGSGTGKTTLLSLLNGTLHAQEGTLTINGHDTTEPEAKELIGFVPQDDLLIEELTVYQNLYYTARLCFDGMNHSELDQRVMNVLGSLGLEGIKDLKVGSALNKTISGGQRKRLNIALELVREPAVLMLDEPTSGLSSADTEHVVGLLKEQTYKGCLVIVNIHQPSSDVYKLFDRLWLLDKGGYPVFDGNPIDAITYFKTAANYADAENSTCPFCGNVQPETMLTIVDEKALDNTGHITAERKTTPQEWHDMYLSRRPDVAMPKVSPVPHTDQRKPSAISQFLIQLERNVMTKITNRQYLLITFLVAPLLAVICAWLTRYAPESGYTVVDNKNFVSFLFMSVIVATFIGMSGSAEEIIRDRALLKREKFLRLSYGSYISSKIVLVAVVCMIQTGLYVAVGQGVMQFYDLFLPWWGVLFAAAFVAGLTGLLLSQCLNSVVAIYITIPLLLIPQILLCGLVVDFNDLNSRSTTGNVPLIGNVIPSRWAYEALAVTTFADNAYEAPLFDVHRRHYEAQYYRVSFLYELESQLETLHDEQVNNKPVKPIHQQVLHNELPHLAAVCDMKPYQGDSSYQSLKAYFDEADNILMKRGNKATLEADRIVCNAIETMGRDNYRALRASHWNDKLESVLTNATSPVACEIVDGHIVPRMGQIYLSPQTRDGQAPFYCSYRQLGSWQVDTYQWNMLMLALMALITAVLIYSDCPGRYMRK